jgi:hypothetical protein
MHDGLHDSSTPLRLMQIGFGGHLKDDLARSRDVRCLDLPFFVHSCLCNDFVDANRHVGESITQQQLVTQMIRISTLGNSHATDECCASAPWWSLQASRDYPALPASQRINCRLSTPQARWKGKASNCLLACSYYHQLA